MEQTYQLIHNKERNQYEFHVDKYTPKIEYLKPNRETVFLTHTEVPAALGGKGIGSELVKQVLADIEESGAYVVPLCPFVKAYIMRHPEWKHLVSTRINV
ncbi:MAG: N-acetyltransferase [Prevotellaceae bacterium]|jgi:predicted GNAT family acetyltransferase|nr:N-acetyltransferase [Prevotellaceae bacterium]